MADSTNAIREYNRETWSLGDLRQIVDDTTGWDDAASVMLTAPSTQSRSGTIEVVEE